ncbi:right-handed parallel beta-helix repeat-containing protein [Candidatus Binatia bacterium]|nr:right-handed parallel beta-helix repeat-containing protein [Candidatus Binatia bacterium]
MIRPRRSRVHHLAWAFVAVAVATPVQAAPRVYVANLGAATVSAIDAGTNTVTATIPVGTDPDGIAATPDGRTVFVSNFVSDDVSRIDTASDTVIGTIPVGTGPVGIAVSPDGTRLYVANKLSNTLSVLDAGTGVPVATLSTGPGPNGVAVHPDGNVVYVTNSRSKSPGTVTVVDARTNAVIGAIAVQHSPGRVAFSPDGRRAYVTNFNSWTVSVIDTAASAVIDTLPAWGRAAHVAVNPNGAFVYVCGLGGRVQVIDARTHETVAAIGVEASPYSFALLPTGAAGFATGFDADTVSVVDIVAEEEVAVVPVGRRPFAATVVCPGGCNDAPFTPPPTRTPTQTPVASPTLTPPPTPTPRPTLTPAPTPHVRLIAVAHPVQDGHVRIGVTLDAGGELIAGAQNDLVFDRRALRMPSPESCTIDPAVGDTAPDCASDASTAPCKALLNRGQWPCFDAPSPENCPAPDLDPRSRARLIVLSFTNTRPIPEGSLYSCTFEVLDPARLPTTVEVANAVAATPQGQRLEVAPVHAVVECPDGCIGNSGTLAAAPTERLLAHDAPGPQPYEATLAKAPEPHDGFIPVDGSRPVRLAAGRAGDLWFTDAGLDRVGRLEASGALTLIRLRSLSGPAGLAVDAAGTVWVALNDRNRIARLDPATGRIDEIALPRASQPFGVTVGPEGEIWFTETGANAIGRLAPGGALSHFPLPTHVAAPMGIVAADDGNVWFTEYNANRIGRIGAHGTITEYPLPAAGSAPLDITTAPDGSIWFTEFRGGRIGRITPDGIITEINLPGPGSRPAGISVGGDGGLWVTDVGTRQILRRAPDGTFVVAAPASGFEEATLFGAGIAANEDGFSAVYAATSEQGLVRAAITPPALTPVPSPTPTPSTAAITPVPSPTKAAPGEPLTPTVPSSAPPTPTRTSAAAPTTQQKNGSSNGGCQTTSRASSAAWVLLLLPAVPWLRRPGRRALVRTGGARRRDRTGKSLWIFAALMSAPVMAQATVQIDLGTARGAPDDLVHLVVTIASDGTPVVATVNDFTLPAGVLSIDPALCRANPAINRTLRASVLRADATATVVRVVLQAETDTSPIPDGVLYTCPVRIAAAALPATFRIANAVAIAIDPAGARIADVDGADGSVAVSLIGRVCTGDCNDDGTVTVDEIVAGVTMALGLDDLLRCLRFDRDGSGVVTVDELLLGVASAQNGCVAPPTPPPTPTPTPTPVPQSLYVRATGDDASSGMSATEAVRTINHAARLAPRGGRVVVGPGTYREGVTTDGSGRPARQVTFLADPTGALTGDLPGPVVVDAAGSAVGAGFRFANAPGVVVDGFEITGAADGGVVLKSGSDDATVRNCRVRGNPGSGIRIQDSVRAVIFNNLVHDNAGEGIAVVGQAGGSPDAWVISNTIARNGGRGLTIGTSRAASPGAQVRNNVLQENGSGAPTPLENIKVFTTPASEVGYAGDYNLVYPPTYLPADITGANDIPRDAGFEFPGGGDFRLRQDSPAIDAGDVLPRTLGVALGLRSATGTTPDTGRLDLGYHFPPAQ